MPQGLINCNNYSWLVPVRRQYLPGDHEADVSCFPVVDGAVFLFNLLDVCTECVHRKVALKLLLLFWCSSSNLILLARGSGFLAVFFSCTYKSDPPSDTFFNALEALDSADIAHVHHFRGGVGHSVIEYEVHNIT